MNFNSLSPLGVAFILGFEMAENTRVTEQISDLLLNCEMI